MPGSVGDGQIGDGSNPAVCDDDGLAMTHGERAVGGVGNDNSTAARLRARLEQELYALQVV